MTPLLIIPLLLFGIDGDFKAERQRMVKHQLEARDITDEAVLRAMSTVPRHEFAGRRNLPYAYDDSPLPIGYGQTISQPYIVALMTQLLGLKGTEKVLEVGTGSGYQAAVLSPLVDRVCSVEIIQELAGSAAKRLSRLGFENVEVREGDGYYGWAEEGPFDAIVVTAAASHVPPPLIEQLKEGGRMVVPVGGVFAVQTLMLIEKKDGKVRQTEISGVRFVPLTGGH